MKNKLSFKFKGQRDYVHGSDIFNTVEQYFLNKDACVVDLEFRGLTKNHLLLICNGNGPSDKKICVQGKFIYRDNQSTLIPFWLIDSGEPVLDRYDFNEASITSKAVLCDTKVSLSDETSHSVIENVIALTKLLSYSLLSDIEGKWLFGQLKLRRPWPKSATDIQIERRAVVGRKFTINTITLDNVVVGEIHFVVGRS